ncbi:protein FAM234A [Trichosurus vulpecula]|uniref:protein FAM234A n=1 Tax=Trichosurus vulpecula TaxID=9337 RepID=UPI00186B0207|nr:protein FAM234A [Trichosurus vulpecula]XP_036594617.1 protein FAM234A [Trichosurus vulpecula]XP_036594618.1 protein FAM234A [Trichosurus vulpecula]
MMDKELEAEIHPLKHDDRKPRGSLENRTEKDRSFKKAPHHSRFAHCRTIVFFFLLFTSLFAVFIISFIIPCPDRPISEKMWEINFNTAVTYDFMAFKDINEDTIQDIFFLYKDSNSSSSFNISCTDEGFSSPCAFLAAVSGANGSLLWERPVAQDVAYMECFNQQMRNGPPSTCFIVGKQNSFLAVDSSIGEILWHLPWHFGVNDSILSPFLKVPDVTGDGIQDLLLFIKSGSKIKSCLYSSTTGDQVASISHLNLEGEVGYIMHITNTGAYYIIFHSASSLYGYPLKDLYEEMTGEINIFEEDPYWKIMIDNVTHRMPPSLSMETIRYLMKVPGDTGEDILLVKSDACELLDGQKLISKWTLNVSEIVRKPVLGYYKPGATAIVLENGAGVQRKILIVDAASGAILWSYPLIAFAGTPKSATVKTADRRSAFFFWSSSNQTETVDSRKNLYMFHPTFPDIFLEFTNVTKNIVAFNMLFEQNHHASYVLLTGPTSQDWPGLVSLSKQKVKENVLDAEVIWLGQARPENEQTIKDRFYELRYKREA